MKRSRTALFLLVLSMLAGCIHFDADREYKFIMSKMTVEQKVGQLFMVGNLGDDLVLEENFAKYHFGNVFLGFRDINDLDTDQIAGLTEQLQALAQKHNALPLLVATDQEGGRVNRVKRITLMPSQEIVGTRKGVVEAEAIAAGSAMELSAIGINTNFSPVVDVNTNKQSHIAVNRRSFGDDPQKVAAYGAAYLKGYRAGDVIGCAKHFPGYGDVAPDPHKHLPSTGKTLAQMEACELVPYAALINAGAVDMIMTAHVLTPAATGDSLPATISKEMIDGLLRQKLKYNGVVVTDDFNMGAMTSTMSMEELAVKCVNAGVDILLFVDRPERQQQAWNGVMAAVKDGRISPERLDASVMRIVKLKKKYGIIPETGAQDCGTPRRSCSFGMCLR